MMSGMSAPAPGSARAYGDGLPVPRRYWSMLAIAFAIAMSVLDSTIANVALPTIGRDLGASPAASIWVINAYQLTIVVLLLPLAALGEIAGYRRVSLTGLALFTLGSLACAFAPTLLTLSLARAAQGTGAAAIMSVSPALLRFTYPQSQLGRAVGIVALVVAASAALGPTIAAAVLSVAHWRWLFGINIPLGGLALAIGWRTLPLTEAAARAFDYRGALLYSGACALLLGGLQSLALHSTTPAAAVQMLSGTVLAVLLVRYELPRAAPILPLDLLRIRLFSLSIVTAVCAFMAQAAALVALPFEIQRLGHSAVQTGLLITPWPLALAVAAPLAGRLADRHGAGALGGLGLLLMAAGLVLLATFSGAGSLGFAWRMALSGLGFGFFQAPNNRTLLSAAPRARSGAAGGMLSAARLLGQSLGAATVAILFRAHGTAASHRALYVAALLALLGSACSATRFKPVRRGHP
jgi:MFS transporter, DHA2 family, multidrug resistance protein